jgi:hypothetical protein
LTAASLATMGTVMMPRKSPTTERRNRLTVELAVCGLGPHAIAKRTG